MKDQGRMEDWRVGGLEGWKIGRSSFSYSPFADSLIADLLEEWF
jgi:hypothetical protein